MEVVGDCSNVADALTLMERAPADTLLLDYDLGNEQGLQIIDQLRARGAELSVLIVTAGMPDETMLSAIRRGTAGIFLKHSSPAQLIEAIRSVKEGRMWLDPRVVKTVLERSAREHPIEDAEAGLSAREKAVLKCLLSGAGNKEIAVMLELSESSVKAVLQRLFARAGVRTRAQLVRYAMENNGPDWRA